MSVCVVVMSTLCPCSFGDSNWVITHGWSVQGTDFCQVEWQKDFLELGEPR